MPKPTNAELDAVKEHLILFKADADTKLPLVQHDPTTDPQFKTIAEDARFSDLPFAVIQYNDLGVSRSFLYLPDESWDIGSGGKISIAAAALSLRRDVRSMALLGLIGPTTPARKFDDLLHYVWTRPPIGGQPGDPPEKKTAIVSTGRHFPLPSIMFEVSTTDVQLRGINAVNFKALQNRPALPPDHHIKPEALARLTFGDRMHLTMSYSDNLAARSCQGTVGIGFINSVCEKLGLYDTANNLGLRIVAPYAPGHPDLPPGWRQPQGFGPRARGKYSLKDIFHAPYGATVRSLATLMSAIMSDTFIDFETSAQFRQLLATRADGYGYGSHALNAITASLPQPPSPLAPLVVEHFTKIGAWRSNAEFAHIKIDDLQYSIIILGLVDKNGVDWQDRSAELGVEIHKKIMP